MSAAIQHSQAKLSARVGTDYSRSANFKAPKLDSIGRAAAAMIQDATRGASELQAAAGATVQGGTEYAQKLLNEQHQAIAGGGDKKDSKGKGDAGDGSSIARDGALTAEELRSIIASGNGLKRSQKLKFMKDVEAQLSGQLKPTQKLVEQIKGWVAQNQGNAPKLFGYQIVSRDGQLGIETGPSRLDSIKERLNEITKIELQLTELSQGASLESHRPDLHQEKTDLLAEAELINSILVDLKTVTEQKGISVFINKLFGKNGLKWSPQTMQAFASAVVKDVMRFLSDEESFEKIKALIDENRVDASGDNDQLKAFIEAQDLSPESVKEVNRFHDQYIKGKNLIELRSMHGKLSEALRKQTSQQQSEITSEMKSQKLRVSQVDAQIKNIETQMCAALATDLQGKQYLQALESQLMTEGGDHTVALEVIYKQTAEYFLAHLPDYQRLKQQYAASS